MPKNKSLYVCQQCGYSQTGWAGKCPECGNWGSLVETYQDYSEPTARGKNAILSNKNLKINLSKVLVSDTKRTQTNISELDRVLGGGLVNGQVILIAGEPGIGKSTLLLQVADKLSRKSKKNFFYACGEESAQQIKVRAERLNIKSEKIELIESTDVDQIIETISQENSLLAGLVVDSIQTMQTLDLTGMAGSVGQVRECAYRLVRLAKTKNIPIFIVGHVTKEGSVAGPSILKHIVDTVLWFEGDRTLSIRMIRATKNRFGATDEVGIFIMSDNGLVPVLSPEKMFLNNYDLSVPGSVVSSVVQGTRPILVEIQALVTPTKIPIPRRVAQGLDAKRLEILLAVLSKRCGINLYDHDCFVNVSGGINLGRDPSVDLAVCLAIASSYFDKPLPNKSLIIGEVDLLGSIRQVSAFDKRKKEAESLGYKILLDPSGGLTLHDLIKKFLIK